MLLEKLNVWGQVADRTFQNGRDPYIWHRDNPEDSPASVTCAETEFPQKLNLGAFITSCLL